PSCVSSWNMCRVEICFPYRIVLTDPARGPSPTTTNTDCESSFDVTNSVFGAWTYMGPFSVGQNLEHTALVGRTDAVERADHVERAGTALRFVAAGRANVGLLVHQQSVSGRLVTDRGEHPGVPGGLGRYV